MTDPQGPVDPAHVVADVRFGVKAAVGGDPRLATYMVGEHDEAKARAKATELWRGGATDVQVSMEVTYIIAARKRA